MDRVVPPHALVLASLLVVALLSACSQLGPEPAAGKAFENWATHQGLTYRYPTYHVESNDGTIALVRVTVDLRAAPDVPWTEDEAIVQVTKNGQTWEGPSTFPLRPTARAQATAVAIFGATATAVAGSPDVTTATAGMSRAPPTAAPPAPSAPTSAPPTTAPLGIQQLNDGQPWDGGGIELTARSSSRLDLCGSKGFLFEVTARNLTNSPLPGGNIGRISAIADGKTAELQGGSPPTSDCYPSIYSTFQLPPIPANGQAVIGFRALGLSTRSASVTIAAVDGETAQWALEAAGSLSGIGITQLSDGQPWTVNGVELTARSSTRPDTCASKGFLFEITARNVSSSLLSNANVGRIWATQDGIVAQLWGGSPPTSECYSTTYSTLQLSFPTNGPVVVGFRALGLSNRAVVVVEARDGTSVEWSLQAAN